jgi:CYTH domain-containing protein
MPVENELKYVLDDPTGNLEEWLSGQAIMVYDILQAYLDADTRIRQFTTLANGETNWILSFKRKIAGKQIEIEAPMTQADFLSLLPTADVVLTKRRYRIITDTADWDIDFLKNKKSETYFVLAEAEMSDGQTDPGIIPEDIINHMIFEVGELSGFGNKKLSDPRYAGSVLKELRKSSSKLNTYPSLKVPEELKKRYG